MKGSVRKPRGLLKLDPSARADGSIALQVSFIHNDRAVVCGSQMGNVSIWQVGTTELFQSLPHDGRRTTFQSKAKYAHTRVDHVIMAVAVRVFVAHITMVLSPCRDVRSVISATLLRVPHRWVPVRISSYGARALVSAKAPFSGPLTKTGCQLVSMARKLVYRSCAGSCRKHW